MKERLFEQGIRQVPDSPNETSFSLDQGSALIGVVYEELRKRAAASLRQLPVGETVQPTDLVHEAYLKLDHAKVGWKSEAHFLSVATLAIRQVVVDRIRAKRTIQRGEGKKKVSLEWDLPIPSPPAKDEVVLAVDAAIEELRQEDPRAADIVVFRFFLGMTVEQCASVLGVTDRTVRRDWLFARTWLASHDALGDGWSDSQKLD